jgi:transcription antitermination factor NusG
MPLDASVMAAVDTSQQATGNVGTTPPTPSGSRPGPRWFVISTYPQAERRALDHLEQQGYQAYLPLCTVRRRDRVLRTMTHRVEVPLFAGYLFAYFDALRDPWRPILSTLGVYALLRRPDGMPDPVAMGAVEAVQAAQALAAPRDAQDAPWRVGDLAGPASWHFGGLKGIIVEIRGKRAILAVMLGEKGFLTRLSVDVANLVARE